MLMTQAATGAVTEGKAGLGQADTGCGNGRGQEKKASGGARPATGKMTSPLAATLGGTDTELCRCLRRPRQCELV